MIQPLVKRGDIIDIVEPASGSTPEDIEQSYKYIESLDLVPRHHKFDGNPEYYHAHTDAERALQFYQAASHEDSKVVWCLRGGYGSARLFPYLDTYPKPNSKKCLIGFSDITALHRYVWKSWDWMILHASVLLQCGQGTLHETTTASLEQILFGQQLSVDYKLVPFNVEATRVASLSDVIYGGNLSVVQTSIGTEWSFPKDGILFLEDVDEAPYRIDRMLNHLVQSGFVTSSKAVILGDMTGNTKEEDEVLSHTLYRFARNLQIPVYRLAGVGHRACNMPLPLGIKVSLTSISPIEARLHAKLEG